jgi:hypothetical protein
MRKFVVLLLLSFALALSSVSMCATTQDFNAYGVASGLGAGQAEDLGIFSLAFPGFTLTAGGSTGLQLDAPGYFGALNYELLTNGGDLTIAFAANQNAFSIDLRDFTTYGGTDTITVYGADDVTVLNTYFVNLNGTIATFSDAGESAPIGAVNLSIVNGENWSGILQSVTYNGGTTPEPGTLVLFGSSVLGLAGLARRKMNL